MTLDKDFQPREKQSLTDDKAAHRAKGEAPPLSAPEAAFTAPTTRADKARRFRSNRLRPPLILVVLGIVVGFISLLPLIYIILRSSEAGSNIINLISRPRTIAVLMNSASLAIAVTLTTVGLSLPIAWALERTDLPAKRLFRILTALPLTIPTLVGGYAFLAAFGYGGIVHIWLNQTIGIDLGDSIYGFTGSWIVLSLLTYPYVLLPLSSTFRALDMGQEETARSLGHSSLTIFRKVLLPSLSPAVLSGALLVSLYTLSDFAAVSLLQFDTFTRVIYVQYQASFNRQYAAVLALILVLLALVVLWIEGRMRVRSHLYRTGTGSRKQTKRVSLKGWKWPLVGLISVVVLLGVGVPVGVTIYWLVQGLSHGGDVVLRWEDAKNSGLLSLGAAAFTVLAALPVALLSVRYPSRLTTLIERATYVSHALPGIVVALSLVFFGARYGGPLYQTIWMMILAYMVLFLPQSLGAMRASLLHVSPNMENVARSLGYSPASVWAKVTLPLIRPGMLSGGALVFLTAMKELPAALLLSPPGFRTLTTSIWGYVTEAFYARAAAPALILVLLSGLSLVFILRDDKAERE